MRGLTLSLALGEAKGGMTSRADGLLGSGLRVPRLLPHTRWLFTSPDERYVEPRSTLH